MQIVTIKVMDPSFSTYFHNHLIKDGWILWLNALRYVFWTMIRYNLILHLSGKSCDSWVLNFLHRFKLFLHSWQHTIYSEVKTSSVFFQSYSFPFIYLDRYSFTHTRLLNQSIFIDIIIKFTILKLMRSTRKDKEQIVTSFDYWIYVTCCTSSKNLIAPL